MSGIISEHEMGQPEGRESTPQHYQPTKEEQELLALVKKLFYKNKIHRSLYDADWIDNYHFFRGKQWDKQRPSYRHAEVWNMVFQTIQSQMPLLTDSSPRIEYLPQEPSDRPVSEIMNMVAAADWESGNWNMQLAETILDSNIYPAGHSSLQYNPETQRIEYKSEETVYCYPHPEARDVNMDNEAFFYVRPRDLDRLKGENPDKAMFLKSDIDDLLQGSKNDLKPLKYKNPAGTDGRFIHGGENAQELADKSKCLEIIGYIYDKAVCYDDKVNEQGETIRTERLKYPKGRCVKIASGVVLKDEPNPYEHGEIPFQRLLNYILPREYWGISEIEQLKGPQRVFNKLVSFTLDVLTLAGAPVWVVDTTSGVDTDNLVTRPGMVIEKEPNSEVRMEPGVQLQPWVLQLIDRTKEWFDQIAGSQDVTRGNSPAGVTAASAITALQEAAQTRIRQKAKNLECYLQSVGQHYKSCVFQFYTAPRMFRLTNNEGVHQYFKMHTEQVPNADGSNRRVFKLERYNDNGTSTGQIDEYELRADLDVKATMGSSLPFNKENKKRELLDYFDRGIVDEEEVLKGVDYPNREAVLQRIAERKQAEMQAAQAGKPAA